MSHKSDNASSVDGQGGSNHADLMTAIQSSIREALADHARQQEERDQANFARFQQLEAAVAALSTQVQESPRSAKSLNIANPQSQQVDPHLASTSNKGKSQLPVRIELSSDPIASFADPRYRVLPTQNKTLPTPPLPKARGGLPMEDPLDDLLEAQ
jgi:hypothetical protein